MYQSKSLGKIDYLIENEYLPIINGENNCQEFYGANVLEVIEVLKDTITNKSLEI